MYRMDVSLIEGGKNLMDMVVRRRFRSSVFVVVKPS
jgi:hypothetical protein